jgi:hypothetical protein
MTTGPSFSAPMTSPAPVAGTAEAEGLVAHFLDVMDRLVAILQKETDLVRAGRLGQASECAEPKGELTRLYIADTLRLRASQTQLSHLLPQAKLAALRQRHDAFRALLQFNLTVLATAHAVSEGIVRGVSGEMARKLAPQTYGASGRTNAPSRHAAAPLAVSRML